MVQNIVILAGGSGTRLWPASITSRPKQFMNIDNNKSLFQMTLERSFDLISDGLVIVVTHKDHINEVKHQFDALKNRNISYKERSLVILPEPAGKNTAPAIAYACAYLTEIGKEKESLIVLPSDHSIKSFDKFKKNVSDAAQLADEGYLACFGIPPANPNTGYGYIEAGKGKSTGNLVLAFHEKPDRKKAEEYLKLGNYYWNSGMFTFRSDVFLQELQKHAKDVCQPFLNLGIKIKTENSITITDNIDSIALIYDKIPAISVDYAVMEKSSHCAVIKADFIWNDVGSWDQLSETFNTPRGITFTDQAENNFVFSEIPVALSCVKDLIVVIKNGMALICRKGSSQNVKNIVEKIKENNKSELL